MKEMLAAAVPCGAQRHTATNVENETVGALVEVGILDAKAQIFATVSDNGSNMKKAWQCFDRETFCADHTAERSAELYSEHELMKPAFVNMRGVVGHFNHSILGKNELHEYQLQTNLPVHNLCQHVATRWHTQHSMAADLRANQAAVMMYDINSRTCGAVAPTPPPATATVAAAASCF
jgi:hypothetical protein